MGAPRRRECAKRDQDIDFGCFGEQDKDLQPLRVPYGVTAE